MFRRHEDPQLEQYRLEALCGLAGAAVAIIFGLCIAVSTLLWS